VVNQTEAYESTAQKILAVHGGSSPETYLEFVVNDELEGCGWCPAKAICPARLCGAPAQVLEAQDAVGRQTHMTVIQQERYGRSTVL
jgi:hypothetical protein